MAWLAKRDKQHKLEFVDVSAADFADQRVSNISRLELNTSLHLRTSDEELFKDLDAIHMAYKAIGLGWLTAPTRLPGLKFLSDRIFDLWKQRVRGITRLKQR